MPSCLEFYTHTHQFLSLFGVVIDERFAVDEEEDSVGSKSGLGVVGSKGRGLTNGERSENECKQNTKDVEERDEEDGVSRLAGEEGTEAEHHGIHDEHNGRWEGIDETVQCWVEVQGPPTERQSRCSIFDVADCSVTCIML